MKTSLKKVTFFISISILLAIIAYFSLPFFLSGLIEKRIVATIEKFKAAGIEIHYDSLRTLPDRVIFDRLEINIHPETNTCNNQEPNAKINKLEISGFHVIPLLLKHSLQLDSVVVTNPIVYHQRITKKGDQKKEKKALRDILIHHLLISEGSVNFIDSGLCEPSIRVNFESKITGLSVHDLNLDSARWDTQSATVAKLTIALPFDFYTFKIREVSYNSVEQTFNVDSIQIMPDFNKHMFALKSKHQTDRIEGYIPSIKAAGFEIKSEQRPLFHVSSLNLNFNLDVFRDKRYPFKNKLKLLPVRYLHTLPVFIQIDTVRLTKSYIAYEEFQEDGAAPGKVFFDKLSCKILNVSNHSNKEAVMEATSSFMDKGLLTAHLTFPASPGKPYSVKGKLTNFPLPAVNSMLTTAAHAEISKGNLEELNFQFKYNDVRSDGTVELSYTDLKMTSLLKKKEKVPNRIVTFILRLVVKKDMDDNLPTDKKDGTIQFYRDTHRSVFNYWWKSILSGIKSVYNMDKITDTDGSKKKK
jgi:hypothetical protein